MRKAIRQTQHPVQWCLPLTLFSETNTTSRPRMSPSYLIQWDKLSIQTTDVPLLPDSVTLTRHPDQWCLPLTWFSDTNSAFRPMKSLSFLNLAFRPMMSPSCLIQWDKLGIQTNDVSLLPDSVRQTQHPDQWCLPLIWFSETNSASRPWCLPHLILWDKLSI